jgi:hypothetical protein
LNTLILVVKMGPMYFLFLYDQSESVISLEVNVTLNKTNLTKVVVVVAGCRKNGMRSGARGHLVE